MIRYGILLWTMLSVISAYARTLIVESVVSPAWMERGQALTINRRRNVKR